MSSLQIHIQTWISFLFKLFYLPSVCMVEVVHILVAIRGQLCSHFSSSVSVWVLEIELVSPVFLKNVLTGIRKIARLGKVPALQV